MKPFRPRTSLATALAATAALGLAGCLQTDDQTTLRADGSGTMSQTVTMNLGKLKELEDLAKAFSGGAPGAPGAPGAEGGMDLGRLADEVMSEKRLRADLEGTPGVEVKKLTSETKDGKRVMNMDLAFADFSALGKGGFQTTNVELKKNEDGTWTLAFDGLKDVLGPMSAPHAAPGAGPGAEGVPGMPPGMDMSALMGMLEPYFGDLTIQRRVTVPGKIVSTNGTASEDGTTVEWKVTFKDIASGATAKEGPGVGHMSVTFEGTGLTLKPFTYKPDAAAMRKKVDEATKPGAAPAGMAEPVPAGMAEAPPTVTPPEK